MKKTAIVYFSSPEIKRKKNKTIMSYPASFVEFFGPSTWKAMHSIAFSYGNDPFHPSAEEHKAAIDFFGALKYLIPCHLCRRHYTEYIEQHPIKADSRDELARWVFDLHNSVNKRTEKPEMSYAEVSKMYAGYDAETHRNLGKMSKARRLRHLADPHFGRGGGGTENQGGATGFVTGDGVATILGIGAVALIAGFIFQNFVKKRQYQSGEKTDRPQE
jgi:hypothetical protein